MDGGPEHDPSRLRIEAEQQAERRISDHDEGGDGVGGHHREGHVGALLRIVRHHRRRGEGRRGTAHGGRRARERAVAEIELEEARQPDPSRNGQHHGENHEERDPEAEIDDVAEGDADAEQADGDAQQLLDAPGEARLERLLGREPVQGDAEEERDHHGGNRKHRRDARSRKAGRNRDRGRQGDAGGQLARQGDDAAWRRGGRRIQH